MSIFALMFLGNDIVQLHKNLYVFGAYELRDTRFGVTGKILNNSVNIL